MEERIVECADGSRWKVIEATRSSLHRLELAFESLDEPGLLLRAEATAQSLAELSERELCFLVGELRG